MQMDTYSIPEAELARDVVEAAQRRPNLVTPTIRPLIAELRGWDGRLGDGERGATIAHALRIQAASDLYEANFAQSSLVPSTVILLRALRERPQGWVRNNDYDA